MKSKGKFSIFILIDLAFLYSIDLQSPIN